MVTSAAGAADSTFDDEAGANAEDDGASVEMEEKVADGVTFHSKHSADSSLSSRIDVAYFFSQKTQVWAVEAFTVLWNLIYEGSTFRIPLALVSSCCSNILPERLDSDFRRRVDSRHDTSRHWAVTLGLFSVLFIHSISLTPCKKSERQPE